MYNFGFKDPFDQEAKEFPANTTEDNPMLIESLENFRTVACLCKFLSTRINTSGSLPETNHPELNVSYSKKERLQMKNLTCSQTA